MNIDEIKDKLDYVINRSGEIKPNLHLDQKKQQLLELQDLSAHSDFWNDQSNAQQTLKRVKALEDQISYWDNVEENSTLQKELLEDSIENNDKEAISEIEDEAIRLAEQFRARELEAFFTEKYDENGAVLAIHAGAGGVDAQDWAEMLLRMYTRFFERVNFDAEMVTKSQGDEAGIKTAVLEIDAPYAYGYLKSENGVHRLVRQSPFNSDNLRQTSFALVEVLPLLDSDTDVEIDPGELRIDTFRASGAGGQHVNKTDSAVRIIHLPTKLSVEVQSERSQAQNKDRAMKILKAKLHQLEEERQQEEKQKIRGEYSKAEWGNQIRSYVLHPYKMVKDHRTKKESSNAEAVLDGEIFPFIEAYLQYHTSEKNKDL